MRDLRVDQFNGTGDLCFRFNHLFFLLNSSIMSFSISSDWVTRPWDLIPAILHNATSDFFVDLLIRMDVVVNFL